jgi:hypothetical protein
MCEVVIMRRLPTLSLVVALMFSVGGCSFQRLARQQVAQTTLDIIDVYDRETDIELARQTLPVSLKLLEGTISSDPDNPILLTAAVRSYARYTWGFVELEIEQARLDGDSVRESRAIARATDFYQRAIAFGRRALMRVDPVFASDAIHNLTELQMALERVDSAQAAALYWTAFAHGSLLRFKSFRHELPAELTSVQLMMKRVTQLNSGFLSGKAHAFLGAFYAHLPLLFGEDMSLIEEHLERALRMTDSCYLPVRLAYVRYYLRRTADIQDYYRALREIAEGTPDGNPCWALDNAVARSRAKMYLRRENP